MPERIVGALGVPDEHAGVEERGFLTSAEAIGGLEPQQVGVVILGEALLPPTEGSLRPSVLALDRLRHVDAAQLLEGMLEHACAEDPLPRVHEGLRHRGHVEADRLCLGARSADAARLLEVAHELGIGQRARVYIADPCHEPIVPFRMYKPPCTRSVTKMFSSRSTSTSLNWIAGCPTGAYGTYDAISTTRAGSLVS